MSSLERESDLQRRALLPAGLRDVLQPDAAHEASTVETLIACCERHGYGRVKPPLVEFEDSLFSGPGTAMTERAFRVMDPVSQRMMGIRADMTVQIARIAATRLGHLPRPLRLCYAGEVLRVTPDELNPERELVQVGAELVGTDIVEADSEVILLAAEALRRVGVTSISVDITAPRLVPELLAAGGIELTGAGALRAAIDRKDPVAVENVGGPVAGVLTRLMAAAGSRAEGLKRLQDMHLPEQAQPIVSRLEAVATMIAKADPVLEVTIDPVENRGFEYYTGIGFSLFSEGVRGELGRGGRYMVNGAGGEGSCGFTLYMESVLRAIPQAGSVQQVYVPFGTARAEASALREDGWITVIGFEAESDPGAAAERFGCSHILHDGSVMRCAASRTLMQSEAES